MDLGTLSPMLKRIEKGEACGILAWHPDRLARNMLDGGRVIHLVDTGAIKDMKFPTVDFQATSQGKLTLAMLFFWTSLDRPSRATAWGFAAACALNVLTKGLIGIVFPAAIVLAF